MNAFVDTSQVKRAFPIDEVVSRYGIELQRVGRALVGRCPFHPDGGRPNLHVYCADGSWYCYRCCTGGDVITFVMRLEGLGFRDAVARLGDGHLRDRTPSPKADWRPAHRRSPKSLGSGERACLAAATEVYHNRLLTDGSALRYVEQRGLERPTLDRWRIGYASGDELVPYLRWRRLPVQAAVRLGLLRRDGREVFAGRVVVPEIRAGQPIWLIGRTLADADDPKYLGLPGAKPLLGWESAVGHSIVILVEGIFDWLTLVQWGFPALALVGTHVPGPVLDALATRFARLYLALDADDAGRAATEQIVQRLGNRAVPINLPSGVKDVAELAPRSDGRDLFARCLPTARELAPAA